MKKSELTEIISEEVSKVLEISMTRKFTKAVEALQKIQLEQQKLRKAFVAEKNPVKKEKLKKAIIKMHHEVKKAEEDFNRAMQVEPVDYIEDGKIAEKEINPHQAWKIAQDATISKIAKAAENVDLEELDVRKTHGDKRIENPATGNDIKLRTALKAKKGSAVYTKGKAMYNALKDELDRQKDEFSLLSPPKNPLPRKTMPIISSTEK